MIPAIFVIQMFFSGNSVRCGGESQNWAHCRHPVFRNGGHDKRKELYIRVLVVGYYSDGYGIENVPKRIGRHIN
jgi:hypothetical protein